MLVRFLQLPKEEILALGENARRCFVTGLEIMRVSERLYATLKAHLKENQTLRPSTFQ